MEGEKFFFPNQRPHFLHSFRGGGGAKPPTPCRPWCNNTTEIWSSQTSLRHFKTMYRRKWGKDSIHFQSLLICENWHSAIRLLFFTALGNDERYPPPLQVIYHFKGERISCRYKMGLDWYLNSKSTKLATKVKLWLKNKAESVLSIRNQWG